MPYIPSNIESKWQQFWDADKTFVVDESSPNPKFYALNMFPSPSGKGLHVGHPAGYTAYCASKAAVDGITKALGCELGPTGITVNAIAPTVFRSPLTQWMFEDDEKAKTVRAGFLARVPKGRLGEPEDLSGPLLFLASKASDFYTGHILYADGGYTAG